MFVLTYIYNLIKSKIMKRIFFNPITGIVILLITISCKVEPQAIEYGKDQCGFCSMNIVDKTHASQYVTTKGKQFKFDSIECMLNDLNKKNKEKIAVILVANFGNPGDMIIAKTASYLISEEIKSPMGANLSAFQSLVKAEELKQVNSGDIYNWTTLKEKFSEK
jgi:copper chaperone NosL